MAVNKSLDDLSLEELKQLRGSITPVAPSPLRSIDDYSLDELKAMRQGIADAEESSLLEKGARHLPDFAERGALNIAQQFNLANPDEQDIKDVARLERRLQQIPMSPEDQAALQKVREAKGFLPSIKEIGKQAIARPSAIGELIGEGAVESAPQIAATGAGAMAGAPAGPVGALTGAIAGGSAAAGAQEYEASKLDYLRQKGVDFKDEAQLSAALKNPKLMAEAEDYASKRAAIMTGANAASMGIAGRLSGAGRGIVRNLTAEGAGQAAIQGAGEAGAEYASTGEVTPGQVVLAGTAGAIAQAPEAIMAARLKSARPEIEAPMPERTPVEEDMAIREPLALPAPTPDELRRGSPEAIIVNPEGGAMPGRISEFGDRYYAPEIPEMAVNKPRFTLVDEDYGGLGKQYYVNRGDGKSIGSLVLKDSDTATTIRRALINDEDKGKGYFSDAYAELADKTLASGKELHSDEDVSVSASKLYDSLAKRGYEVIKDPSATLNDGMWQTEKGPVYRVVGKRASAPEPVVPMAESILPEVSVSEVPTKTPVARAERLSAVAKGRESAGFPEEAALYRAKAEELSGAKPSERFTKAQADIQPKVVAALKRMNPGIKVETAAQLFGEGNALKRSGAMSDKAQPVAGGYDDLNKIARISLDERYDPMDTAFHEGWHSLEPHFSEPDRKLLLDAFPAQGNVNHSERTAIAFANWANKPASVPIGVRPVFTRIRRFLRETGNLLRGKGFNSVDKIFEKAKSGKIAEEAGIKPITDTTSPEEARTTLDEVRYSFGSDPVGAIAGATGLDAKNAKSFLQQSRDLKKYMSDTKLGKTTEGKRAKDLPSGLEHMGLRAAEINSEWFGSIRGLTDVIAKRTGSKTVAAIRDMISPEPGTGRYVAESYQDEAIRLSETAAYKTNKALEKFLDNPKAMQAIEYLVSNRDQINLKSGSAIDRTAQLIADILDDFSKQLDIGHVKDYFPTSWDDSKIIGNSDAFIEAATKAYKAEGATDSQAMESADAWLKAIEGGSDESAFGNGKPSFTKSRVFGEKARAALDEFRIKDPISALNNYYHRAGNLIAYEKRFSADKLKAYQDAMKKEGVSEADRDKVMSAISSATGRSGSGISNLWKRRLAAAQYINSLVTLPRAAISSVMEPVTAGVRTGNIKDSFGAMYETMRFLFSNSKDTQATKDYIGMISGVINDMGTQMMMASRYEMLGSSSSPIQRRSNRFFEVTGLSKLTEAQRLASAVIYENYAYRMAKAYKDGDGRKTAGQALVEHGVNPESLDAYVDYVMKRKESGAGLDESQKEFNDMYALGMRRFVDGSIQHTKRSERPLHANHPVGRLFYALQGYMNGFTQNVLLRSAKMAKRGLTEKGYTASDRIRLVAPAVLLGSVFAASQAALNEAKKVIYYNPDLGKQDDMQSMFQYLNSAGFAGNYGILINSIAAVGYGREPQAVLSGPFFGNYGKTFASGVKYVGANSKNTNTQERAFAKDLYSTTLQPALINLVVTSVPGSLVPFALTQAVSHPATRSAAVEAIAGKKKKKD